MLIKRFGWSMQNQILRLDGKTKITDRKGRIAQFNQLSTNGDQAEAKNAKVTWLSFDMNSCTTFFLIETTILNYTYSIPETTFALRRNRESSSKTPCPTLFDCGTMCDWHLCPLLLHCCDICVIEQSPYWYYVVLPFMLKYGLSVFQEGDQSWLVFFFLCSLLPSCLMRTWNGK